MKICLHLIAALGILIVTSNTMAEGWSTGGGLYGVSYDEDSCDTFSDAGIDYEDNDTGVKLFVGYDINKNFRVEGFFADLGEARADDIFGDSVSVKADGIGVAAIPMGAVSEKWDLYGRLELFSWDATADASIGRLSSTSGVT